MVRLGVHDHQNERSRSPEYAMDPVGHYSRPDVFKLIVNEQERPPVVIIEDETPKEF